jgi:hypothetical protein
MLRLLENHLSQTFVLVSLGDSPTEHLLSREISADFVLTVKVSNLNLTMQNGRSWLTLRGSQ